MPIVPTYPGVYIQEIPSGVRTITGVATSIAAFVGYFARGPMDRAVQVLNMGDFEREFGGLEAQSEASYAIQQFFLNGGTEAWVVRVARQNTATPSGVYINDAVLAAPSVDAAAADAACALFIAAINPGTWGNNLRARIEETGQANTFNLTLAEYGMAAGVLAPVRQEVFRNLSMDQTQTNYVERVVNDANTGSKLARVTWRRNAMPLNNGTWSDSHTAGTIAALASGAINVTIGVGGTAVTRPVALTIPAGLAALALAEALATIARILQAGIRAAQLDDPAFTGAVVDVVGTRLRVMAGGTRTDTLLRFDNPPTATSDQLLFTNAAGARVNLQEYTLGTAGTANTAQIFAVQGNNGQLPDGTALIGALAAKTGLFALEEVDLFNILCIPRAVMLSTTEAQAVMSQALTYCSTRRAFFILDTPPGFDEPGEIKAWLAANPALRSRNAALYYPRVRIPDPLDQFRLRSVGASGTIAGLYARTDAARGVWKAPAGTEATLRNVSKLDDVLTDGENGTLNPLAINCLRNFPVYGPVCWGGRTLEGSDQQASEWKYVPVRRLALFLEESLYRGTQWVVFEPNDEPLWAQIRLNVGAFMHNLFRQGAFQGTTPQQAYLVKCDRETTTQNDINLGIVNILVGFAPLKPAEFVIIKIQQLAGQVQAG